MPSYGQVYVAIFRVRKAVDLHFFGTDTPVIIKRTFGVNLDAFDTIDCSERKYQKKKYTLELQLNSQKQYIRIPEHEAFDRLIFLRQLNLFKLSILKIQRDYKKKRSCINTRRNAYNKTHYLIIVNICV